MLGILLIDKPSGLSSHDIVNAVRRKLGTRRVGHAGTLDPLATGLLVVAVGPATRFLQYLPLEPKEYVGVLRFGVETSTYDAEGEVVAEKPVPEDLMSRLEKVLPQFRGLITQVPPMHSAVKHAGKPLYAYAREGKTLERSPRTIHIETIEIDPSPVTRHRSLITLRVVCSGGTYMRSLAHDLGQALGFGAYLHSLNRERVGKFHVRDAISVEAVDETKLISLREALPPIAVVQLDQEQTDSVREGRAVLSNVAPGSATAGLMAPDGSIIGVARVSGNVLQPECVIPIEASH